MDFLWFKEKVSEASSNRMQSYALPEEVIVSHCSLFLCQMSAAYSHIFRNKKTQLLE